MDHAKKDVLARDMNFNCKDPDDTEFLAALEATLRTSQLKENVQQDIRQKILTKLMWNKKNESLNMAELNV